MNQLINQYLEYTFTGYMWIIYDTLILEKGRPLAEIVNTPLLVFGSGA